MTKPKLGFLIVFLQCSAIAVFTHPLFSESNAPAFFNNFNFHVYDLSENQDYYFPFVYHHNTYVFGIISAYILKANTKLKMTNHQQARIAIWILLFILCFLVFFYPHYLEQNDLKANKLIEFLYPLIDKFILSSMLFWILCNLAFGHLSSLNNLANRSVKFLVPCSRLAFPLSLSQFIYISYSYSSITHAYTFTIDTIVKELFINTFFIFLLGNFIYLFFEAPMINLAKAYLGLKKRSEEFRKK